MLVEILTKSGRKTIEAESVRCSWLCIHHQQEPDVWVITHRPTGRSVARLRSHAKAYSLARFIAWGFPELEHHNKGQPWDRLAELDKVCNDYGSVAR